MKAFAAFAILALALPAAAIDVVDFESNTATSFDYTAPGAYTDLWSGGSHPIHIYRESGSTFDITDNTTFNDTGYAMPASWGNRSFSPFSDSLTEDWIVITFTFPVNFVQIEFGDFGGDGDDVYMAAYAGEDGSGQSLGDTYAFWNGDINTNSPLALGMSAPFGPDLIRSIRVKGGGQTFYQSLYMDNIRFQTVPEPASMLALGLGAAALLRRRRR